MLSLRPRNRRQFHPKHSVISRQVERDLLNTVVTCLRYGCHVHWTVGTTAEKSNGNRLHPELAVHQFLCKRSRGCRGHGLPSFNTARSKPHSGMQFRFWGYFMYAACCRGYRSGRRLVRTSQRCHRLCCLSSCTATPISQRPLLTQYAHDPHSP